MADKNTQQLTSTDATAACIGAVLASGASSWGKDQATAANRHLVTMFKAGKVDDATFSDVAGRLGNHSATRQHLEKHALLTVQADALATAIKAFVAKVSVV